MTAADEAAEAVIREGLAQLAPTFPVISEEQAEPERPIVGRTPYFLVDPLDGTREFIAGRDEYTVNIALVADGAPILGVITAPALGRIWRGVVNRARLSRTSLRIQHFIDPRNRPTSEPSRQNFGERGCIGRAVALGICFGAGRDDEIVEPRARQQSRDGNAADHAALGESLDNVNRGPRRAKGEFVEETFVCATIRPAHKRRSTFNRACWGSLSEENCLILAMMVAAILRGLSKSLLGHGPARGSSTIA